METVETKNRLDRLEMTRVLIQGLAIARDGIAADLNAFKGLSLAAIKMMYAGEELFDGDFVAHLKEKKDMLEREFNEVGLVDLTSESEPDVTKPESKADAVIEEAVSEPEKLDSLVVKSLVAEIEGILDRTTAEGQKEVLAALQASQPNRTAEPKHLSSLMTKSLFAEIEEILDATTAEEQKEVLASLQASQPNRTAEYEAEMARDEARDNLIDLVGESSYPAQTKTYDMLTDFVKRSQDELVTEAA